MKSDNILYIVLDSPTKIKYIRWSRFAAGLRSNEKELKTQIRFVGQDIALFTKTRGTEDPFVMTDVAEVEKEIRLPPLDHTVTWKQKEERQQWRRTSPGKYG